MPTSASNNVSTTTGYSWDNYGNVTQISEWNFGNAPPSAADRTTTIGYLNSSSYIAKNILNRPSSVTISGRNGGTASQSNYYYDQFPIASVTGVINHDDTNYGTANTVRGNLESMQRFTGGSNWLGQWVPHDTTGQLLALTDSYGNMTHYGYSDNYFIDNGANPPQGYTPSGPTNAYLTSITPAANWGRTFTFGYYFGTGQQASEKDVNNNTTYWHFNDQLGRLSATSLPNGGWTVEQYSSTNLQSAIYTGITSSGGYPCTSCRHDLAVHDAMGRVVQQYLYSDPDGPSHVDTQYDLNGRVLKISNPYRSTSDPTYGWETPTYDGLDRITQVAHADGNVSHTFYGANVGMGGGLASQQCSSSLYGLGYPILSVDEAGNKQQAWTDAFGRMIETDEPDSSGNLIVGTCYAYDPNNNLTGVLSTGGTQTLCSGFNYNTGTNVNYSRCYGYDMLSRLISKTDPETGTTSFYYGTYSGQPLPPSTLCSGDPQNVCTRTDARGIVTTYSYDSMNRLTGKTYSDSTPSVSYYYDQTNFWMNITNGIGRRTGMSDAAGQAAWSYDAVGNVLAQVRQIFVAGVAKTISYAYDLDGSLASITYPGGRKVSYTIGNAQKPTWAQDTTNGINYAEPSSLGMYSPQGAPANIVYGYVGTGGFQGITETRLYNNRLEITGIQANSATAQALNLGFNYPNGNNGNISTLTNNLNTGRTQSYTYDPLNRLLTAQTQATSGPDCWGQSFGNNATPPTLGDDALANLLRINVTKCSASYLSVGVDAHNHIITPTGFGYDNAGNMTADGNYSYTYDAENHMISASGMAGGPYCYVYDGDGMRVEKANANGGSCTNNPAIDELYWRDNDGNTIAETDSTGSTTNGNYHEYVFFAGRRIARSDPASGIQYYYFTDQLGSTRSVAEVTPHNSPADGTVCFNADYYPYGQEIDYNVTCPQNYKFTGYERDSETYNDYAMVRYFSSRLGRFTSPDPTGIFLGNLNDPQSLNLYSYVRNNPANMTDPSGLCDFGDCGGGFDFSFVSVGEAEEVIGIGAAVLRLPARLQPMLARIPIRPTALLPLTLLAVKPRFRCKIR